MVSSQILKPENMKKLKKLNKYKILKNKLRVIKINEEISNKTICEIK
jgi:hypothetical protein